ncbi:MAG: 4-hydroxy-tetrahydrodipicolinate synthase [Methylacidiphilales bacterium]|nr:4-hydroxy-tetrahydrodipicolinate synthase [Candidatus Methylacidiphilales bacterium]
MSAYKGTYTALVTPFKNNLVDADAFNALIERQIEAGIDGIVPVGTTGESPTLNHEEHLRVIELAVKQARKRTKVIGGTGSNSTAEAIEYTQAAEELGVDVALLVAPYYNKPTQEGLYQHFMAIASSTGLPLILYSIPGRCGIEISVETVVRLARDAKNIVAIKEAGGSVDRVSRLRQALPDAFDILSGDDSLTVPFMSVGARGVISVASNLIPAEVKTMTDAALAGDYARAEALHRKYYGVYTDIFLEANPGPIKAAMAAKGWIQEEVRLPLVAMSSGNREKLMATLKKVGIL